MNTIARIVSDLCIDNIYEVNDVESQEPMAKNALSTEELGKIVSKFVLRARQKRVCIYELDKDGKHIEMNPRTKTITWNDGATGLSKTLCMVTGNDEDDAKMILEMINEAFYLCYNG